MRGLACVFEMKKKMCAISKATVMTFVVKLDPPGPFLINVRLPVDVAEDGINEWNSKLFDFREQNG